MASDHMGSSVSRRSFFACLAGSAALGLSACVSGTSDGQSDVHLVAHSSEEYVSDSISSDEVIRSFDLHCDTIDTLCMHDLEPYASVDNGENHDGDLESTDASISYDRMNDVRWAQCYAVWTPDDCPSVSHLDFYRRGAAYFHEQMELHKEHFTRVTDGRKIQKTVDDGKVAAILTIENSCALEEGIEVLDEFERDGVMVCGLTWNGQNAVAGGAYSNVGLSALGREYVAELEQRRMIVDVSHLSDKGFWELEELAKRPYIATHSNSRSVCDHPRNLTDDQFKAIRDRGGLVGLAFFCDFVRGDGRDYEFEELMGHVERWLDLGGEDVICLGSDRDGSRLPDWIRDCSTQGSLFAKASRHLGKEIAHKLFFSNAAEFFARAGRR